MTLVLSAHSSESKMHHLNRRVSGNNDFYRASAKSLADMECHRKTELQKYSGDYLMFLCVLKRSLQNLLYIKFFLGGESTLLVGYEFSLLLIKTLINCKVLRKYLIEISLYAFKYVLKFLSKHSI